MGWIRRAIDRLRPAKGQRSVITGMLPGFVWEPARSRWVPESETYLPGGDRRYTLVGPIYTNSGLHP